MNVSSRKRAIMAAVWVACSGSAWAAPGVGVDIPPPRPITKETPAAKAVPRDLQRKADAAGSTYVDCGFAVSREAHRTEQSVSEFARTWAKSCLAEELELKQNYIAILKFRGDPNPRATAELSAREGRAKWVEGYRRHEELSKDLRELEAKCGPDFELCPD